MDKNIYSPILTSQTQQNFFNYINQLLIDPIDYFAIGIQDVVTKKSISVMSRPDWQNHFNTNNFAPHDPLRKAVLNTKRTVIPYDEIDRQDNFGIEIMRQRKLFGITNGLVLVDRHPQYNYMLTLCTNFSRFDCFSFLKNYYNQLILLKRDLSNLIEEDIRYFLLKNKIIH